MTSETDDLRLAADFAPATYDDWRKLVDGVLKGAPFEKLVGKTSDGLKIEPIYRRARDTAPIAAGPRQHPGRSCSGSIIRMPLPPMRRRCRIWRMARPGSTSNLPADPGARGFGVADASRETLARLFDSVILDAGIAIALNPVLGRDNAGINFADLVESGGFDPAKVNIRSITRR